MMAEATLRGSPGNMARPAAAALRRKSPAGVFSYTSNTFPASALDEAKLVRDAPGSTSVTSMTEGCDLRNRALKETLDAPFGSGVDAHGWVGRLAN